MSLESYQALQKQLHLDGELPWTKDWSAAADFIQIIVDHCLEQTPQLIMECSSGLTTLMLARCCEINQQGQLFSLENGAEYAQNTRKTLTDYQLETHAQVLHAPLKHQLFQGKSYQWYDAQCIPEIAVDMLVIDGPPGYLQQHSRFPALPALYAQLVTGCSIFLDDAARTEEQEVVTLWQQLYPAIQVEYIDTERGCFRLQIVAEE